MTILHRPGGIYRRRILVVSGGDSRSVRAGIEDDFHHFEVDLKHDGKVVTAIEGRGIRHPWVTCPQAAGALRALVGQPLDTAIVRRNDVTDVTQQCTHMYDLSLLAIARGARGAGTTRYDVEVADRPDRTRFPRIENGLVHRVVDGPDGTTRAVLRRDGKSLLAWALDGRTVVGPPSVAGLDFRKIGRWAVDTLVEDAQVEAVKVLRQGIFVSSGRANEFDTVEGAGSMRPALALCFAFQPERVQLGLRERGSEIDFTDRPDGPLADFAR